MNHVNVQHYQGKLGRSLHPNTFNKFEGYGPGVTVVSIICKTYFPVRPCYDPDARF